MIRKQNRQSLSQYLFNSKKEEIKINKELENKFLTLYNEGKTTKEIIELLGITKSQGYGFIRRNGLKSKGINKRRKITEKDEELIIKEYLEGKTIKEIYSCHFKDICSEGTVNAVLKKAKITRPNGTRAKINHNYFSNIDNEHKAYWLGFLLADGSVKHHKEKGECYTVTLSLKIEDDYILKEFAKDLESDKEVHYSYRVTDSKSWGDKYCGKPHNMAYISLFSKQVFNDLGRYGVVPNKTYILNKLPNIPKDLMRHLIRGYFDGDGSVFLNKTKTRPRVSFYGTHEFVKAIGEFLEEEYNIKLKVITDQKEGKVSFINYTSIEDIDKLYKIFYNESTIFLKRKKDIFDSVK